MRERPSLPFRDPTLRIAVVVLGGSVALAASAGADLLVRPDGTGDVATIQDALDTAADGEHVILADGVFTGPGNRDLDPGGKAVVVRSGSGDAATTILDCEEQGRGFHLRSGESRALRIEHLTVRNGRVEYDEATGAAARGGGILCEGASPSVIGCVIESCVALETRRAPEYGFGGGLAVLDGGSPLIDDCTFRDNLARSSSSPPALSYGGGLAAEVGTAPEIRSSRFEENAAAGGGGIFLGGAGEVVDVRIERNTAGGEDIPGGGGILTGPGSSAIIRDSWLVDNEVGYCGAFCESSGGGISASGTTLVEGCVIEGNQTYSIGGGAWLRNHAVLRACLVRGNVARDTSKSRPGGGGVAAHDDTSIEDSIITGNSGYDAIRVADHWRSGAPPANVSVIGCTIAGNGNPDRGARAGLGIEAGSTVALTRSILWGNCGVNAQPDAWGTGTLILECSAYDPIRIEADLDVIEVGDQVTSDPRFCDPLVCRDAPTTAGDHGLATDSPCLAGSAPCGEPIGAGSGTCEAPMVGVGAGGPVAGTAPGRGELRAWPSPFHTRVTIATDATSGPLHVLDVSGRRVATLATPVDGRASWDGRSEAGEIVAEGVYFVVDPEAPARTATRIVRVDRGAR